MSMRPAKTQISQGILPVWSESLLCAEWVAKDPSFLHADSKDSDQTGLMPKLIWVFAGAHSHFVGFVMLRLIYFWNSELKFNYLQWIWSKIPERYRSCPWAAQELPNWYFTPDFDISLYSDTLIP